MTRLSNLTLRNLLIALHDALATTLAVLASFYLRFEGDAFFDRLPLLLRILPYFIAFSVVVCYVFNLTTTKWRFISLPDALNILRVATVLTLALLVLDYIFVAPNVQGRLVAPNLQTPFFLGKITIILYWFLEVFFLSGLRFAYRYFRYSRMRYHARTEGASPALLIGRAADAEILLRGIESGAVKHLWPVGVLSPSPADRGQLIRNIPVLGGIDDVEDVIADFARRNKPIARVVMTPSAFEPDARPESVLMRARRLGLIVSRLPSLESGETPRLTTVAVEDLLLRPSENIDYARLEALVKNKAVIVTGGGGSIGSEICDRVVTFGAARLLVIENSEPALYAVTEALAAHQTGAVIEGRIADIRDRERIMRLMKEFKPDIVFHAAALKHVPILERDWSEGVKTNIFGSINVADAALAAGAEAMVMISTDKAIEPVSMLGLTKRFAEMYCQALDHDLASQPGPGAAQRMRLISVRFGNVLASNGSVVPKFKAQIEAGGPVTVTHPGYGQVLHDHPRGLRSRDYGRHACAGAGASGRLGLRAQHGTAGQDRRSCRAHDPAFRPAAGPRYRYRFHRHAAGRAAERNPVRQRGADHRDRRRRHHGGQAQRAADAGAARSGLRRSSRRSPETTGPPSGPS